MLPSSLPADHESSYELLYDEDVSQGELGEYDVLEKIYELFLELIGPIFKPSLSLSRFLLLRERFQAKNITTTARADLEIMYKKVCGGGSGIDFYRFIAAVEAIVRKAHNIAFDDFEMLAEKVREFLD